MKTVGQIISQARQKRGLSIDQLSGLTKIDSRYISALEQDKYQLLPSETFVKGFIRNLCQRLDLNPNELIAIFRRDFRHPEQPTVSKHRSRRFLPDNTTQFLPFIAGGVIFLVYLIFQFRAIVIPPKLSISNPENNAVLVSPVEIEGNTAIDATIFINEDIKIRPDASGHFITRLNFPQGEIAIQIKSVNRFSRSVTKNLSVTIISK